MTIRFKQVLTTALFTAVTLHAESPLRSPWDTQPIKLTAAPYTCPAIPPIAPDLRTDGFYRLDDPTHSIVDPIRMKAYQASADPIKAAGATIVSAADAYRTSGSRAAAQCVIDRTFTLAQNASLTGAMSSNQAFYVQGWIAGAIAIAYLKVRDTHLETPTQNTAIGQWLLQLAHATQGYYDKRQASGDGMNNHAYWAGIEIAAIGVVANDRPAFNWGITAYKKGVDRIQPDGTLPLEMARATRALHYHLYALAPLVLIAEFGEANGIDLYAYDGGAIHRLATVSIDGLSDPSFFEKATGKPQETEPHPSGDQIGWAPPYARRFPNPALTHFIATAPSLSVPYLGGLPPN
ncbi:alginate lyase family protein [Granulicella sibirica]|uniref:Alginate lyase n=1 Tax=Granulicella sibirica TaxID=2479048 RepID=A0A4Q0SZJ5_9BACT|nr:alginate lyase family protein [Granulicella sibirica]RXH56317.1 Alginate lyase precursor [Granulicella sibirica]